MTRRAITGDACRKGHPLTGANLKLVRNPASGGYSRRCLICLRTKMKTGAHVANAKRFGHRIARPAPWISRLTPAQLAEARAALERTMEGRDALLAWCPRRGWRRRSA